MAQKNLTLTRGDSDNYGVTFKQANGTPFCIKNWVIFFTVKSSPDLDDSAASLQKIITAFSDSTSGTSGSANIPILPADTKDLTPGEYFYDISVCTNSSANYTVIKGKLNIDYDITRTAGTAGTAV